MIIALSCIDQGTRAGDLEAETFCRRGIDLSPDYGQAHSLLAGALLLRTYWSDVFPGVQIARRLAPALDVLSGVKLGLNPREDTPLTGIG
jgi:hypothetical protein